MRKIFNLLLVLFIFCGIGITSARALAGQNAGPKWLVSPVVVYMPSYYEYNEYSQMMKDAAGEWISKISNRFALRYTNNNRDISVSAINIKFNRIEGESVENSVDVVMNTGSRNIVKVDITVNAKYDPAFEEDKEAKEANDKDLYAKMLHAAGIMLGMKNSADENSIMYPERKDGQKITAEDIKNLADLYHTKPAK